MVVVGNGVAVVVGDCVVVAAAAAAVIVLGVGADAPGADLLVWK